jgi:serine/threonine protein kinase
MDYALWSRAFELYEVALAWPEVSRRERLVIELAAEPKVAPLVEKLLDAHARVAHTNALDTLPKLNPTRALIGTTGSIVGGFELLELIGEGGMGEVWRARYRDTRLDREVAVKLPAHIGGSRSASAFAERFARERRLLSKLEHPHIARLYDANVTEQGQAYLALELVRGVAIDRYCEEARLSIRDRVVLFLQVIDAVAYAHRQLVLHRDVKLGNVMVDERGQVKLLDFGVAKLLQDKDVHDIASAATEFEVAPITLAYASPEQITGDDLSTATDVYALGVTLYRLLTGQSPYAKGGESRYALEQAVLHEAPSLASARAIAEEFSASCSATASEVRRALRSDLDMVLAKALKKHARERYATAEALGEDLRRYLGRQPILARPDRLMYRLNRFVARNRIAVAASAIATSALIATSVVALHNADRAQREAQRAERELKRVESSQRFVANLFAPADPEQSRGRLVSVETMLERGVGEARRVFADDPETLVAVLTQLGDIYFRMGLTAPVYEVQEARLNAVRSMTTADPNLLTEALIAFGLAQTDSKEYKTRLAAIDTLREAMNASERPTVLAHRRVFALASLASHYRTMQRLDDAETHAQRAVALADRALPELHTDRISAWQTKALIDRDRGRIEQSRTLFERVINADRNGSGRSLTDRFESERQLASLEFEAGNYRTAYEMARALIDKTQTRLGDVRINLSAMRRLAINAAERAGFIDVALRDAETLLAPDIDSGDTLRAGTAWLTRAQVYLSASRNDEARGAIEKSRDFLATYPLWLNRIASLDAQLHLRENRDADAVAAIDSAIARMARTNSNAHRELASLYEWRAYARARASKNIEAGRDLQLACDARSNFQQDSHPLRLRCKSMQVLFDDRVSSAEKSRQWREVETALKTHGKDARLLEAFARARAQIDKPPFAAISLVMY